PLVSKPREIAEKAASTGYTSKLRTDASKLLSCVSLYSCVGWKFNVDIPVNLNETHSLIKAFNKLLWRVGRRFFSSRRVSYKDVVM
ncbi:hypothetical protein Q6283_28290, partial [Klebsiella pneumoniae]|uniref:hypothetical protein n=1 Tax=Klebsiella pneumoniae TaxID=573 RepID=UPI0027303725